MCVYIYICICICICICIHECMNENAVIILVDLKVIDATSTIYLFRLIACLLACSDGRLINLSAGWWRRGGRTYNVRFGIGNITLKYKFINVNFPVVVKLF